MGSEDNEELWERRYGNPRTDEERRARHEEMYPGEPLPERGTGLTRNRIAFSYPWQTVGIWPIVIPLTFILAGLMSKGKG